MHSSSNTSHMKLQEDRHSLRPRFATYSMFKLWTVISESVLTTSKLKMTCLTVMGETAEIHHT